MTASAKPNPGQSDSGHPAQEGAGPVPANANRPVTGPRGIADPDPVETADWLASLESVLRQSGAARARFLLDRLDRKAKEIGVVDEAPPYSPYRNSIRWRSSRPIRATSTPRSA